MNIQPHHKNVISIVIAFIVILLIAIFVINPGIITGRTPGSFEYVRKGEALFDKGKYAEAIKYYEKAYASSPENEAIKDDLIYAFSTYAGKMAENEKYDEAIRYLFRAYELKDGAYTRQNLSLMYAKRALSELHNNDMSGARRDIGLARDTANDSVVCEKSLGITLANYAVDEYKASKYDEAILLLKEAINVYADVRIYEMLGDVYYKKTDLDKAYLYIGKAAKLDPENKQLAAKLEKMAKEIGLADSEVTKTLPNFELKYDKDLPVKADMVSSILEKAYFDVGHDLCYMPKARTVVFLYSDKNFREIFKVREIVRAFYDGNIRMPLPVTAPDEKELASYLYHEYAHAVVSAKTNNNCPVWLSEGIAVYEETKWTRPGAVININSDKAERKPELAIEALNAAFIDPDTNSMKLVLSYVLAYTAVDFMVENWGMKSLCDVLGDIAKGRHAINAIDDEYLLSEKAFNKKWSEFVERKYLKK